MKGGMTVKGDDNANRRNKKLTFKNNGLFKSCISKINNTFVDNAEDLDIAMLMYHLLEYNKNYFMTSGSFWNYYRDKVNDAADKTGANHWRNNNKTTSKSFEYTTYMIRTTPANSNRLDTEVVVPLKYLSNFWRSLDLSLINCEIALNLAWSRHCVISEILISHKVAANPNANPPVQEADET